MIAKHKFDPRWDEQEKGFYCTICGVIDAEHAPFDEDKSKASEQLYYIICHGHSSGGSWDILFWRPDSCGYTIRLDEAGKYTQDTLPRLYPDKSFAIPCEEVDAVAHRAVDRDNHLFEFMEKHLPKKKDGTRYNYGDIHNG